MITLMDGNNINELSIMMGLYTHSTNNDVSHGRWNNSLMKKSNASNEKKQQLAR